MRYTFGHAIQAFRIGLHGPHGARFPVVQDMSTGDGDNGLALVTQEAKPRIKRPPLYKVVLLNDDYTPMEFVVQVLQTFFRMPHDKAVQIMLAVHTRGKAVAGIFTHEIAETKVAQVNEYARNHQHPLMCTLEQA